MLQTTRSDWKHTIQITYNLFAHSYKWVEMRCLRKLFGIWYKLDHITNEEVRKRASQPIGQTPDKINS